MLDSHLIKMFNKTMNTFEYIEKKGLVVVSE